MAFKKLIQNLSKKKGKLTYQTIIKALPFEAEICPEHIFWKSKILFPYVWKAEQKTHWYYSEQKRGRRPTGCKELGYWNGKSEEKILRTTTDGRTTVKNDTISYEDSPEFFFFLLIFNFLKNLVKCFIWIHIVFAFFNFEKCSTIYDRHTSVSRWAFS